MKIVEGQVVELGEVVGKKEAKIHIKLSGEKRDTSEVYVNEILVFSGDTENIKTLFSEFCEIVDEYKYKED